MQPWLHVQMGARAEGREWVLLTYRLPREPSTPRTAVWRKLRALGVAQLSDGLVALPADARTREQLDWVAEQVREANGSADVWVARPATSAQERELAQGLGEARAAEYRGVLEEATAARVRTPGEQARVQRRLRSELRRIRRRDFFPPSDRDAAVSAVDALGVRDRAAVGRP
jgi:DNA-binding transcriptional regulator PaaX